MKGKSSNNYSLLSLYRTELMGIAAIFILIFHSTTVVDYSEFSSFFFYIISYITLQLNIGVEMFLLLSGIGLYFSFSNKKYSFKKYYFKRLLNVYIVYLIIAFPLMLFNAVKYGGSFSDFFLDWSGISFYLGKQYIYGCHAAWYVMFIMVIYLIYPLIFKVQKSFEKRNLDLLSIIIFTVSYILFSYYISIKTESIFNNYEIALTRVPVFLIGSYLGKLVYNKKKMGAESYILIVIGFVVSFLLALIEMKFILQRYNNLLLSISICLLYAIIRNAGKFKILEKFLPFFGKMSLELYLSHNLINHLLFKKGHCENIIQYIIVVIVSMIISFFVSKLRIKMISKFDDKN